MSNEPKHLKVVTERAERLAGYAQQLYSIHAGPDREVTRAEWDALRQKAELLQNALFNLQNQER